tara:strand:- start:121 stop:2001 length:1881 start_codon:yes stop_codon:yes gene_type:complete
MGGQSVVVGGLKRHRAENFASQFGHAYYDKAGKTRSAKTGTGPLIQRGHEYLKNRQTDPTLRNSIQDKKGAVFSLTAGFVPTFTQQFNSATWYDDYSGATVLVNEAFNKSGPAGMMLRGNHVWYKYATDYITAVEDIPGKDDRGVPDLIGEQSILDKIFDEYVSMVVGPSKDVLTSWRNAVVGDLQTSSKEIISKGDLESIRAMGKNPDVPEERIPALLAQLGFGVEVELAGDDKELLETHGKSEPIDIIFKFNGQIYKIDVTQSRILTSAGDTGKSTHTSMGALQTNIKTATGASKEELLELRGDLTTHFQRSAKHINEAITSIYTAFQANPDRFGDKSLREAASEMGARERMSPAQRNTMLDKWGVAGATKYQSQAMDSALHIMGSKLWESGENSFTDILVFSAQDRIIVGMDWTLEQTMGAAGPFTLSENKKDIESGIVIEPGHEFYMDYFMKNIMQMNDRAREDIILAANFLWGADALYSSVENLTLGQIIEAAHAVTRSGYVIAGGALAFEEDRVNEAILNFLEETLASDKIKDNTKVNSVINNAEKKHSKKFSTAFSRIQDPVGIEMEEGSVANPEAANAMLQYKKMNDYLRTHTWATPYVGIYYQGGRTQNLRPLLMGN